MGKGLLLSFLVTTCLTGLQIRSAEAQDSLQINNLILKSISLRKAGNFQEAQQIAESARDLALEKLGSKNPVYAYSLHNLGTLFLDRGLLGQADTVLSDALRIRKEVLGQQHPDYGRTLNNLAVLYQIMGRYTDAEQLLLESLSIKENAGRKDSLDYSNPLNNLARLYQIMGRFNESEERYLECLRIREKLKGRRSGEFAGALVGLANVYFSTGRYEEAEKSYQETYETAIRLNGKKGELYAKCVGNLAVLFRERGQYDKADSFSRESLRLLERRGKEHPDYAVGLNNQALFYATIGQLDQAETFYLQALDLSEKIWSKESIEYARVLDNLGGLHYAIFEFEKSEHYYLQAKEILELKFGKEHPEYARTIGNLALLYTMMKRYGEAENLYYEAMSIQEKIAGRETHLYANFLHNLALLYYLNGRSEEARKLSLQTLYLKRKLVGVTHPSYVKALANLADIYAQMGNWGAAIDSARSANTLQKKLIILGSSYLSDREMVNWINTLRERADMWHSYAWLHEDAALVEMIYDNLLFYKGFLLESVQRLHKNAKQAGGDATTGYLKWKALNRLLAAELARPLAEQKNAGELESKAIESERNLIRSLKGFGEAYRQVNWQDVQAKLKPGEAAVEFIRFRLTYPSPTDTVLYAALVLLPDGKFPRYVRLFEESRLRYIVNNCIGPNGLSVSKLYDSEQEGSNLYRLIWQPLESLLSGVKKIYYSPAGDLHRISFAGIPIKKTGYLGIEYELILVGSTRQLAYNDVLTTTLKPGKAAVFGGINFDSGLSDNENASGADSQTDRTAAGEWRFLKGSDNESEEIARLLELTGYQSFMFSGNKATETKVKDVGNSALTHLYISTHGYFFPDPQDENESYSVRNLIPDNDVGSGLAFKYSEQPLIRSGLIFAGANRAWSGNVPPADKDDGILTSYEISQLDLSNTEFVTLSACDTGLGDIDNDEGVYGLQRAFKIAGAKYVLVSLWETPVQTSREIMNLFYKNILQYKMDVHVALKKAQADMKTKYPDPYFWGGFILVE